MERLLQIPNYFYPHIGGIEQVARDIADALRRPDAGAGSSASASSASAPSAPGAPDAGAGFPDAGHAGPDSSVPGPFTSERAAPAPSVPKRAAFEQKIICFNENAADGGLFCKRGQTVCETVDGIEVTRCGCFAKLASQSLSLCYPAQLKKLLREFRPDTVIFHYPNPFVASFLLPLLPKETRLIVWWHLDITKQKRLKKLFHRQTLRLLQRADKVVATSPNYIEGSPTLQAVRGKCLAIPNCIRPERLRLDDAGRKKAAQIRQQYAGKTICFAVGRHVPYKGMEYLIRASALLDDSFAVLIGGEGPLTASLQKLAEKDGKIRFLGRIPPGELAPYYAACDIFCFPSITKNEAFGIALAEGMYFGKPAVTFTIPGSGVNYVSIAGETGIEVPNRDVKAYAEAIRQLAQSPGLRQRYGENAQKRVQELFLYGAFGVRLRELLC